MERPPDDHLLTSVATKWGRRSVNASYKFDWEMQM